MESPLQSEIVVTTADGDYEIVLTADRSMELGDMAGRILGIAGSQVLVDGYPKDPRQPIRDAGLRRGASLEIPEGAPPTPVCALIALTGSAAGSVEPLAPGIHEIGSAGVPRGSVDVGVQVPRHQGGTACLCVDVDGKVRVDPLGATVLIDGRPTSAIAALPMGAELTAGGAKFRLAAANPPTGCGSVPYNRPPRAEFPAALPTLVAPGAPREPHKPVRFGWGALLIPVLIGGIMAVLWSPMMAIFAIFSPAMMLANWYEERRRARRDGWEIAADVATAMDDFERRAAALQTAAGALARRGCPGPVELVERVVRGDSRFWQRRHDHPDFLELGVGAGHLPWTPEVIPAPNDRAQAANELIASMTTIPDVPVTVDLGAARNLGIAGHRRRQIEVARWLAIQAAAHHGPADLQILIVSDHPEEWDCLKWLPHLQTRGDSGRLAFARPASADDLLAPLLDPGDGDPAAGLRDRMTGPATLIFVDIADMTAAAAASLRRVLGGEGQARRAAIALAPSVDSLPSSCTDILGIDEDGRAELHRPSRAERVGPIATWRIGAATARRAARVIGRFSDPDRRDGGGDLPETVHLLDLLGLEPRSSDAVLRRWQATGPIPRCAAPIGATAEGTLSIDWVEDGPHGLLAGTTGAGKSELLRSLVASLAATVDPEHLNFILIDYKGGSAFDACAGLPHTVGMVTDLDGHLAHRALTCLEAELRHREEVLRAATADNIHDYHALGAAEPMPRLLVVIDEFAALAKELPDFMASLVDVAQRGRSLGVHLLLATQRPNGVISDAIRANTNLRLSLRVQDVADSTDVIGTGDAAQLARSRPGRGFLRRGPGDIVAFQSALVTGTSGGAAAAIAVRPFELLPSAAPAPAGDGAAQTDLDVLVSIVQQAARKAGFAAPRLLWPEPLPAEVTLAAAAAEPGAAVLHPDEVVIGLADEPHRQRRRPFSWSIGGSLFFYGVQGSGTSSALRAAIVAACGKFSVDELHVYAIDFDDQSLGALERLPQVGAVIGAGERARQIRLLRYLQREVAERRERVATDPAALEGLPRIVVAVDNYAGFRAAFEDPSDMAIKESLGRIVADGPGVGIVVLATAKQPIDIPTTVASLVPSKLVFTLADRYEYAGLGVAAAEPTAVAGRAFESGTSLEVQLARVGTADVLAVEAATEPATLSQATPWSIELLPAEVKIPDIAGSGAVFDLEWKVPVGLGDDRLQPVGWTIREGDHVLISGPARSGKSTALVSIATILRGARSDMLITGLVSRRSPLLDTPEIGRLVADPAELAASLADVAPGVPHAILIDDAEDIDDAAGILVGLLAERTPHRHCFVAGSGDILRTAYGHWTQSVRRSRLGMALSPTGQGDGDLWQVALPRNMPVVFPAGRGYLIADGTAELAQVAWQ